MQTNKATFTRTYDETLDLIVEARDYMRFNQPGKTRGRVPANDLRVSCEALRVTSRLTQVMAWLMMQRAVCEGEITAGEACEEKNRLSGHAVCLDVTAANDDNLPPGLRSLLHRSLQLYQRISRLEEMVIARVLH